MLKPLALSSIIGSIDITSPSIIVAALQTLLTSTAYFNEKTNQTPYSKFAIGKTNNISSKNGMLIIYVPALCYNIANCISIIPNIQSLSLSTDYSNRCLLIGMMLTIHFLKRTFETLFVHRYSGGTDLSTSISIGVYYTLVSVIVSYFSSQLPVSLYDQKICLVGIIFFVIGQVGNFYHHYILANLRKDVTAIKNDKEKITKNYKIPKGSNIYHLTYYI